MKRIFQYIIFAVTLSMTFFSLNSCKKEENIIDENDLAKIYAEMLITDQWINTVPNLRTVADTSLVYEPILKKYGYTSVEYRNSVEYYLNDPEEFADIMKETIKILDKKLTKLQKKKGDLTADKARDEAFRKLVKEIVLPRQILYLSYMTELGEYQPDSLSFEWDSLALCYAFHRVKPVVDTTAVADSLQVADTIPQPDTLDALKELTVLDSVPKLDTTRKKIIKSAIKSPQTLKISDTLSRVQKVWD